MREISEFAQLFLSGLMGYWIGSYIKKVSVEPGRVSGVAGWWNCP